MIGVPSFTTYSANAGRDAVIRRAHGGGT